MEVDKTQLEKFNRVLQNRNRNHEINLKIIFSRKGAILT